MCWHQNIWSGRCTEWVPKPGCCFYFFISSLHVTVPSYGRVRIISMKTWRTNGNGFSLTLLWRIPLEAVLWPVCRFMNSQISTQIRSQSKAYFIKKVKRQNLIRQNLTVRTNALVFLFITFVKFITIPSILGYKAPHLSDYLCPSSLTKLSVDAYRIWSGSYVLICW